MIDKKYGRYHISSNKDYEPGSNNQVLKNYLGIKNKNIIEQAEAQELERVELELFEIFDEAHQFTAEDICNIYKLWLGNIYPFAGKYRSVNMTKGGFPFANANQIPSLMEILEKDHLRKYTPCNFVDNFDLTFALGIIHVELIVIHPFREGNGRVARLLADLMSAQANRPPLKYSYIEQDNNSDGFGDYIKAIHAGFDGNYQPIQDIFKKLLIILKKISSFFLTDILFLHSE